MPRCFSSSRRQRVEVLVVERPGVELVLDAVQAGGQDRGHGQVRVARAVHRAVLDVAAGQAQHLGAVVGAVGDEDRRPGGARGGRAGGRGQPLVAVDGRRGDRDVRLGVLEQAGGEVVAELGEAQSLRIAVVGEQVGGPSSSHSDMWKWPPLPVRWPNGLGMNVASIPSRLRHRVHHVAEEDRAVGGGQGVRELEVRLELAVRVLVVVGVAAPAELVDVGREPAQELVVAGQALHVVTGLVELVERVGQLELAVAPRGAGRTRAPCRP